MEQLLLNIRQLLKKDWIRRSLLGFSIILVFLSVWHYFHSGQINVGTDNKGYTIGLRTLKGAQANIGKKYIRQAKGELATTVPAGTYIVDIINQQSVVVSKTLVVTHGKTARYYHKSIVIDASEPVSPTNAQNVFAGSGQLIYQDSASGGLVKIDAENPRQDIYPGVSFRSFELIDSSHGVGQDRAGTLFTLDTGVATKISLPMAFDKNPPSQYAIAGNNRLYAIADKGVYSGFTGKDMRKIFTTSAASPSLAVSDNILAVINIFSAGEDPTTPFVETVTADGKIIAKQAIPANQAVWSPDGKRLAVINSDGTSAVYDKYLHRQAILPSKSTKTAAWASNNTLLYSVDDTLWSLDLNDGSSLALGKVVKGYVSKIAVNQDSSYAYLIASTNDSTNGVISRVGLKGQPIDRHLIALGIFLPEILDTCTLSYSNFSQPTIIISYLAGTSQQNCLNLAKGELLNYSLDINKFQYKFLPGQLFD